MSDFVWKYWVGKKVSSYSPGRFLRF